MAKLDHDLDALRRAFPTVQISANRDYFIIRDFGMPTRLYSQERRHLLVCIPPTYPAAPPDNFFVEWGLALSSGAAIGNYGGPVQLYGEQWGQFSHHLDAGAWHVVSDPSGGDNLLTYLATIVQRLQQGA